VSTRSIDRGLRRLPNSRAFGFCHDSLMPIARAEIPQIIRHSGHILQPRCDYRSIKLGGETPTSGPK